MFNDRDGKSFEAALAHLRPLWAKAADEGVPGTIALPSVTLKDCILATTARRQNDVHIYDEDRTFTFAQSNAIACRLANALAAHGVEHGRTVFIMLGDIPELIWGYMACYKLGAVAVGINPRSTAAEIARLVRDCNPAAFVFPTCCGAKVQEALDGRCDELPLVAVDDTTGTHEDASAPLAEAIPFPRFLEEGTADEPHANVAPGDVAVIIHTGGTTGIPKGCPLTHANLLWAQYFFYADLRPRLQGEREMISLLTSPMVHAYGLNFGVNWGVVIGGAVVLTRHLDSTYLAQLIETRRPTVWGAVPRLLREMVASGAGERFDLASLAVVVVSCTVTAPDIARRFAAVCPAAIVEDYGMSETAGPVTLTPVLKGAPEGTVGIPVANTDILVVDEETGTVPMAASQTGEVIFRGPQIIGAYLHGTPETQATFREGWLYSGDIGSFDDQGYLTIAGRIKDMINVNGFSVFPREIDETATLHPKIADACTIGVADEAAGERPKTFAVLKPGETMEPQELIDYCHEYLIAYKCPKYVEFIGAIPHTAMGKPDKLALQAYEQHGKSFE